MPRSFLELLLLPAAVSLAACGGSVRAEPGPPGEGGATDAGVDAAAESGTCADGGYPVECNGVVLYCCPSGAHCDPPSCGAADAGDDGAHEAGACPSDQYLLVPCCGGFDDTSCSNGPGPPAPFCTALPPSCEGQSTCTVGGCEGPVDGTTRTLQCTCI